MTADRERTSGWEVGLAHYQEHVRETGSPDISVDYVCRDNFRLGRWIHSQRLSRRNNRLRPERFEALSALGLPWDPRADLQNAMVQALREFNVRKRHSEVPAKYVTADGLKLGSWVRSQRLKYSKGTLNSDLIAEFESVGVTWDRYETLFLEGLEELAQFIQANGSTHVPRRHITTSGFDLGYWFQKQKAAMSKDMPSDRRKHLEALGVQPDRDVREEAWQSSFAALMSWVAEHGHASVPKEYVNEDGVRLGQWLSVQRNWLNSGRLQERRRSQLDSMVPDWRIAKPKWAVEEAIASLQTAATMAFPLSPSEYRALRIGRLVSGPSDFWFVQRFGTWRAACEAADVEAGASTEGWTPYSQGDVTQALEDFFEVKGDEATANDYDSWALEYGAPLLAVVLRRQGVWTDIRRRFGRAGTA